MNDSDFIGLLRRRHPPDRTSTWRGDSPNAVFGAAVEIVLRDAVQRAIDGRGLRWRAIRHGDVGVRPADLGALPMHPAARVAVENSYGGDIYVMDHHGEARFTIEAKGSQKYPGASITEAQLMFSEASYVAAVTTEGLWACTMQEARRRAVDHGDFWVIPYHRVKRIELTEMFQ